MNGRSSADCVEYQMKKLIAGNWKMNGSLAANEALLTGIKSGLANLASPCDVAVCAPGIYLPQVQGL